MKQLLLFALLLSFTPCIYAQSVAINAHDTVAHPSAGLDVNFANKGLLIPRVNLLSITDTVTVPSPANALMIYNTNSGITGGSGVGFYFYCRTGCASIGWKPVNFADSGVTENSEWKFHSKLTVTDFPDSLNFNGLPRHNKWKLVLDLHNSVPNGSLVLRLNLNHVAIFSYFTRYEPGSSSANFTGTYWALFSGMASNNYTVMNGEVIITDQYAPYQNAKTFIATLSHNFTAFNSHNVAAAGFSSNDFNDISSINLTSQSGPVTGTVELWYRDYK